jgi:crotonobetainyl-CoA:carnitine CoA-transferase CaiB-like acyl-CoA transferase
MNIATYDPVADPVDAASALELERAFAVLDVDAAIDLLTVHSVPAVSVLPRSSPYTDPWLAENGFFHRVEQTGIGECTIVAGYATWAAGDVGYSQAAPANGEHTRAVLQRLGFDADRVSQLIACGAAHETV